MPYLSNDAFGGGFLSDGYVQNHHPTYIWGPFKTIPKSDFGDDSKPPPKVSLRMVQNRH